MKNLLIFAQNKESKVESILKQDPDFDVRLFELEEIKNAKTFNPTLIVVEGDVSKIKEILMVTKIIAPTLIVVEKIPPDLIARGSSYEYVQLPLNEEQFSLQVKNLIRIKDLINKVKLVSTTDELTGLHNRKFLHERLEAEISRANRYQSKLSLVLFDIDYFKVVNDMYGYEWGDVLLKQIAQKLQHFIRKEDILTRYGDEEFIVVLPNTSEENAYIFSERFRKEIEKMEFIPSGEEEAHKITISGGISSYPFLENVEETANSLIRYAEHALYNAKKRGKNKIVQFSQMNIEY